MASGLPGSAHRSLPQLFCLPPSSTLWATKRPAWALPQAPLTPTLITSQISSFPPIDTCPAPMDMATAVACRQGERRNPPGLEPATCPESGLSRCSASQRAEGGGPHCTPGWDSPNPFQAGRVLNSQLPAIYTCSLQLPPPLLAKLEIQAHVAGR